MKKAASIILCIAICLSFSSCSFEDEQPEFETKASILSTAEEEEVTQKVIDAMGNLLYEFVWQDNGIKLDEYDGELELTIETSTSYLIPLYSDRVCPVMEEVVNSNTKFSGYQVKIREHVYNSDDNRLVMWMTRDGKYGTFMDAENGGPTNCSIDKLYEQYEKYIEDWKIIYESDN